MLTINEIINVTKYKFGKIKPFSYPGKVVEVTPVSATIEAFFNRDDLAFHEVVFNRNDRFVETYYPARWYNIFEVHDRDTDILKCWYCNVAQPAVFERGQIWFIDMELDVLVYPDQSRLVLDEDEFDGLNLPDGLTKPAQLALEELIEMKFKPWAFTK